MEMPLVALVMIVKNEAEVLPRFLSFSSRVCTTATVCDTGSTDETLDLLHEHLPDGAAIYEDEWLSFGENLTSALERARGTAEWLLRLDADMIVGCVPNFLDWLRDECSPELDFLNVEVTEPDGSRIMLPLLTRAHLDWRYVGVTHEYLDKTGRRGANVEGIKVTHIADGSNREEKFRRDIELLRPEFRQRDPRAVFYTAQSHRALGNNEQAALIYDMRSTLNGFEEERWYARYAAAKLRRDVPALLKVWRERPWRHEPLTAAANIVAADHPGAAGDVLFLESVR